MKHHILKVCSYVKITKENINKIRTAEKSQTTVTKIDWTLKKLEVEENTCKEFLLRSNSLNNYNPPVCTVNGEIYTQKIETLPLLSTTWGQGVGYNNLLNNGNCTAYSNGKYPTGCVATAMAQILKFNHYPSSTYNYSLMPGNTGSNETSKLMKDLGSQVAMNYACSGSGAQMSKAESAFRMHHNYKNAKLANYDANKVFSEIAKGHPVMLSGTDVSQNVGHAWIADGSLSYINYECELGEDDGDPYTDEYTWNYKYQINSLHLNWGWNGSYNGYFSLNRFTPGDDNYSADLKMITNLYN